MEDVDGGFDRQVIEVLMEHETVRLDGGFNLRFMEDLKQQMMDGRFGENMMEDLIVLIRDIFIGAKIVWRQGLMVPRTILNPSHLKINVAHADSDTRANFIGAKSIWKPGLMVPGTMLNSSSL